MPRGLWGKWVAVFVTLHAERVSHCSRKSLTLQAYYKIMQLRKLTSGLLCSRAFEACCVAKPSGQNRKVLQNHAAAEAHIRLAL